MSLLPLTFEKKEEVVRNERNTQAILREMHETHAIASNTIVALNEDDGINFFIMLFSLSYLVDKLREAHLTLANIQDNLNKTDVSLARYDSLLRYFFSFIHLLVLDLGGDGFQPST